MPNDAVTCASCGFLAIRHLWDRTLHEAEPDYRLHAKIPKTSTQYDNHERMPVCFAQAIEFRKEIARDDESGILPVIGKSRKCDSFMPWRHGFSPKEHQEMLDRQWLLDFQTRRDDADRRWRQECDERDRTWRETQAENERHWRDDQAREDRNWREQSQRDEERRHKANLIVMGLLTISAGLVGAAIQANWIPNFFSWLSDSLR